MDQHWIYDYPSEVNAIQYSLLLILFSKIEEQMFQFSLFCSSVKIMTEAVRDTLVEMHAHQNRRVFIYI